MGPVPETRYAKSGQVHIAYQVVGEGPLDLVFSPSPVSNLEVAWEWPPFARFLRRLASFSRLILFDKRGTGLSDRVTDAATLDERMDDLRAVTDAAGSERAAIFGTSEGGPLALLFAATYPDRTTALVLYGSYAKSLSTPDYPHGTDPEMFEMGMALMEQRWGECALIDVFAPSMRDNDAFRRWLGRYERQSASPGAAVAIQRLNARIDVRPILASVRIPTLILYRADEYVAHVEGSKYLARHIPGARYEELEGVDYHPYVGDQDAILDRVEEFLTGTRRPAPKDRVLASLLSIDHSSPGMWDEVGDVVTRQVARFGGHLTVPGERGVLATFDRPSRAIECALAIRDGCRAAGADIRVGGHIGEIERNRTGVSGAAVEIATAVQGRARDGEVLISRTLGDLLAGSDFTMTDAGEHHLAGMTSAWQLFAVSAGGDLPPPSARPAASGHAGVFRREGDVWLLGLDEESVRVRDMKGLADIAMLLSRPGREVHVAELVAVDDAMGDRLGADPRLDAKAIAAYRAKLTELEIDEDEAATVHDPERAARARAERDALVERLSSDLGLGGRSRMSDDWVERARKAVRTRVAKALKRIEAFHPSLGRHLRASVRTGAFCAYEPVDPITWTL